MEKNEFSWSCLSKVNNHAVLGPLGISKFDDFLGGLKAQHIVILIAMIYYREKIQSKVRPYVYPACCTLTLLNKTYLFHKKRLNGVK